MSERPQTIGAYLRSLRQAVALTQSDLADLSGLQQSRISVIEADKAMVRLIEIKRLAQALPVDYAELERVTAETAKNASDGDQL